MTINFKMCVDLSLINGFELDKDSYTLLDLNHDIVHSNIGKN